MTSTPKYTPGPWEISENAAGDIDICEPGAGDMLADLTGCPNAEANATLMIAAPTMLETLRSIAMIASCAPNDDPERADQEFEKIMNMANRAVKTAMGE